MMNFDRILRTLGNIRSLKGLRILDVGCGHGWFGETASKRGCDVLGIEPEAKIAEAASGRCATVWRGYFPEIVPRHEKFDVLVFNDVFEHLPDLPKMLDGCRHHLAPEGVLIINCPSSRGLFFRLACTLDRCGMQRPLDRLWQRAFHSPHLSYFNESNLEQLVASHGFKLKESNRVATVTLSGLWNRLRMDQEMGLGMCVAAYVAGLVMAPLTHIAPPDVFVHFFQITD